MYPIEFVAVDFETANRQRTTPCSLGITVVKDSIIVSTKELLINPEIPSNQWDSGNTGIHGISYEDVQSSPNFPTVYKEILKPLNVPLVAHNMRFDGSVLDQCCDSYGLPRINLPRYCTYELAKEKFPQLPSHSLDYMISALNLPVKLRHHHSGSDSEAAAALMISLSAQVLPTIDIRATTKVKSGSSDFFRSVGDSVHPTQLVPKSIVDGEQEITDQSIVSFTGELSCMSREYASAVFEELGATVKKPTLKTTTLIIGKFSAKYARNGIYTSNSLEKILRYRNERGKKINLVLEDDLYRFIDIPLGQDTDYTVENVVDDNRTLQPRVERPREKKPQQFPDVLPQTTEDGGSEKIRIDFPVTKRVFESIQTVDHVAETPLSPPEEKELSQAPVSVQKPSESQEVAEPTITTPPEGEPWEEEPTPRNDIIEAEKAGLRVEEAKNIRKEEPANNATPAELPKSAIVDYRAPDTASTVTAKIDNKKPHPVTRKRKIIACLTGILIGATITFLLMMAVALTLPPNGTGVAAMLLTIPVGIITAIVCYERKTAGKRIRILLTKPLKKHEKAEERSNSSNTVDKQ